MTIGVHQGDPILHFESCNLTPNKSSIGGNAKPPLGITFSRGMIHGFLKCFILSRPLDKATDPTKGSIKGGLNKTQINFSMTFSFTLTEFNLGGDFESKRVNA